VEPLDLFVDTHVTDGADYQYDTTYGLDAGPEVVPAQAEWRLKVLSPYLESSVAAAGQVIGPFIALKSESDPSQGMVTWQSTPRFSTGYMILQNRTGILVETHMLKDYRTRVLGTYHLLRALLEVVNREADTLLRLDREADAATIAAGAAPGPRASVPLRLEPDGSSQPFLYRGIEYRRAPSPISGAERIEYLGRPQDLTIPRQTGLKVTRTIAPPRAYIVPAQWTEVIDLLQAHGLRLRRTTAAWAAEVETYRCENPKWAPRPYEGRQVLLPPEGSGGSEVSPGHCVGVRERLEFPPGSAVVPLDQRAARVAIHLLEPEAPDSVLAWGFLNAIFEQKEYAEAYVMEKLAPQMLAADRALKAEFEARLASDKDFAANPQARLDFFYRRSPWWDRRIGLYPVGRLASLQGVPLGDAAR
jgi:hypothetical protein